MSKILIVDDDCSIRMTVSAILSKSGFETVQAAETKTAMEILQKGGISLILLDVVMPNETGYQFLERLNKDTSFSIPVIFMTGQGDIEDKIIAFELGAIDYIVKPFHRLDVIMRVKAHMKIQQVKLLQESQLLRVSETHRSYMPVPDDLPDAKFGIYFNSLLAAGGDFYEVIQLDDKHYAYFVADISGHDIATSYVMPAVKALMKEILTSQDKLKDRLKRFNGAVKSSLPDGKFITALLLIVDREKMKATLVNMGHIPMLIKPIGQPAELIETEGDILGVFEDPEFGLEKIDISHGDRLILSTDGLLESQGERTVWTKEVGRTVEVFDNLPLSSIGETSEEFYKAFKNVGEQPEDDILIMAVEI